MNTDDKVKFYLEKRKDKSGELITHNVPVNLFFSYGNGRLQYYTGIRIDAQLWDEKTMKPKRNAEGVAEINRRLNKLRADVEDIYAKAVALGEVMTPEYFKKRLKSPQQKEKGKPDFRTHLEEYFKSSSLTKSTSTVSGIKYSFKHFENFATDRRVRLAFENITQEFYDQFLDYCFSNGLKNNYTGRLIKDLKAFLNWATERGYNTNLAFKKKSFKRLTEEPEILFLTYEELLHFYNFKFENKSFAKVRDIFCFGCFTGMRFSDIKSLAPENIHKDQIRYRVVKTNQTNTIPLNSYTQEIIERYKGDPDHLLPVPSEQKTNKYLKDAAELAELKRNVQTTHYKGAQKIRTTLPLHKVLTFHMSKKTFMTNFLARGGSLLTAMSITGNKDLKTARRYYKVVDSLKDEEMKRVFGA